MNGKQSKRLRRAARGLAVTLTEAGRDIKEAGYVVKRHEDRFSSVRSDAPAEPGAPAVSYQVLTRPDSLRGIYKKLKSGNP